MKNCFQSEFTKNGMSECEQSPQFGAGVRFAGVTQYMPPVAVRSLSFGADDCCLDAGPARERALLEPSKSNSVCFAALRVVGELRRMHPLCRGSSILRDLHRCLSFNQT